MSNKGLETNGINRGDIIIPPDLEEIGYRMIENGATAEEATAFVLSSMQARRDVLEREQILEKMVAMPDTAPAQPTFLEKCRDGIREKFGKWM